jgi:hypothetical protein
MSDAKASVVPLPGTATERVAQRRGPGRYPSVVARLPVSRATLAEWRKKAAELRAAIEYGESQVTAFATAAQAMQSAADGMRQDLLELRD